MPWTKSREPPFAKNASAAHRRSPFVSKRRSNSWRPVTSTGLSVTPAPVIPTNPAVEVLTPSIVLLRKETSSTKTPGWTYSVIGRILVEMASDASDTRRKRALGTAAGALQRRPGFGGSDRQRHHPESEARAPPGDRLLRRRVPLRLHARDDEGDQPARQSVPA